MQINEGEKVMEEYEYRHLRGILTYLAVFGIVAATTMLRFYDKISPELTGVIFGFILGVMLGILGSMQKEWLKNGK